MAMAPSNACMPAGHMQLQLLAQRQHPPPSPASLHLSRSWPRLGQSSSLCPRSESRRDVVLMVGPAPHFKLELTPARKCPSGLLSRLPPSAPPPLHSNRPSPVHSTHLLQQWPSRPTSTASGLAPSSPATPPARSSRRTTPLPVRFPPPFFTTTIIYTHLASKHHPFPINHHLPSSP